ncbi:MAG TPA: hypothetical protein VGX37_11975, partial [Allosphingosinicella sp.]|nr:hypothetical protein [Allosphingosinicella sp.]
GLGATGPAERARALQLARAGLAADRGNVHAYTVLGFCYLWHQMWDLARNCFEQALALNPYNPVRLNEAAAGMVCLGEFARARALLDMSLNLQQFPDDAFYEDSGRLRLLESDNERARIELESIAAGSIWADLYLAICELRLGRDSGRERFGRWRERVTRCWYKVPAPSEAEISDWIRRHHPWPGEAGELFFTDIESALRPPKMPSPHAATRARQ